MKTLFQMAAVAFVSLILGMIVNQLNPDGIPARLLLGVSLFPDQDFNVKIEADSAFVLLFQENIQFIDIRPSESYEQEHLPDALSFPFQKYFRQQIQLPDAEKTVVLYGEKEDSLKVRLCMEFLQKKYENTLMLKDGLLGWLEYGFPTEGDMP